MNGDGQAPLQLVPGDVMVIGPYNVFLCDRVPLDRTVADHFSCTASYFARHPSVACGTRCLVIYVDKTRPSWKLVIAGTNIGWLGDGDACEVEHGT